MKKFLIKVFEHYFKYFYVFRLVPNEKENNIAIDKKFELKIIEDNKSHYFDKILLPQEYLEIIKSRLKSEYFVCFAVIDTEKDQLAYYSWINLSPRYWVREVNQFYFFGRSKSCLFEDDNTLDGYRGYKLHSYVMRERINYCSRNSYNKIYIVIQAKNIPAIKTVKNNNFYRLNFFPFYMRIELFFKYYQKK